MFLFSDGVITVEDGDYGRSIVRLFRRVWHRDIDVVEVKAIEVGCLVYRLSNWDDSRLGLLWNLRSDYRLRLLRNQRALWLLRLYRSGRKLSVVYCSDLWHLNI